MRVADVGAELKGEIRVRGDPAGLWPYPKHVIVTAGTGSWSVPVFCCS
ncbi:hypothetical protein NRK68_36570 (plasmid) [Streptomyces yangpuensis]|uniref:Uncharacterized protein n=1 Tax=Streptomyces yangpuensis TaxID=1648182 RepID=A0ABY5Q9C1_9ACTN|nr:hypothetical protein [Streptomyces yangpuensis]UUY52772.1 hypothetical protein NRK68_36570 [Streptomyces yangpuensis]